MSKRKGPSDEKSGNPNSEFVDFLMGKQRLSQQKMLFFLYSECSLVQLPKTAIAVSDDIAVLGDIVPMI